MLQTQNFSGFEFRQVWKISNSLNEIQLTINAEAMTFAFLCDFNAPMNIKFQSEWFSFLCTKQMLEIFKKWYDHHTVFKFQKQPPDMFYNKRS